MGGRFGAKEGRKEGVRQNMTASGRGEATNEGKRRPVMLKDVKERRGKEGRKR